MKITSAAVTTSSRLDRGQGLSPEVEERAESITAQTIAYCNEALDRGRFFRLLQSGGLPPPLMNYAFLQYKFWRDQFHKWFALCIIKSGSCHDPDQKNAVMALADH